MSPASIAPRAVSATEPIGASRQTRSASRARRDHAGVEPEDAGGVAVAIATATARGHAADAAGVADVAEDAQRDHAGAGGRVVPEDDAAPLAELPRRLEDEVGHAVVATLDDLDRRVALPDDPLRLRRGDRGGAAVAVGGDRRPRCGDVVGAHRAMLPGIRGAARVHRDPEAVPLGDLDEGGRVGRGFDRAEPDLPDEPHPLARHLGEVRFHESLLQNQRAAVNLRAQRRLVPEALGEEDRLRLRTGGVLGRPGKWGSPAEIIVVTPPCTSLSRKSAAFWRKV